MAPHETNSRNKTSKVPQIICGEIAKRPEYKEKERYSNRVLIVSLKNVCMPGYEVEDELKIYFHRKAAKKISALPLHERDKIAVLNPKLFDGSPTISVGLYNSNSLQQCFRKPELSNKWSPLEHGLRDVKGYSTSSEESSDNETILARCQNRTPRVDNEIIPRTPPKQQLSVSRNETAPEAANKPCPTEKNSSKNTTDAGTSISRILANSLPIKHIRPLNAVTIKLVDACIENTLVVCCGVITSVVSRVPKVCDLKRVVIITIQDETIDEDFPVHILCQNEVDMPILGQYDIIWLNQMKIVRGPDCYRGHVSDSKTVATFDRETGDALSMNPTRFTYCDDHKARIQELRKWMFEKIPESRLFTPLANIESKSGFINLRGYLVKKKMYKNHPNVILRFRDDSQISLLRAEYDLSVEEWNPTKFEIRKTKSDVIDICILETEIDSTFRRMFDKLYEGCRLEIREVKVFIASTTRKALDCFFHKFYLENPVKNLKILKDSDHADIENIEMEELYAVDDDGEAALQNSQSQSKKRKLFNNDSIAYVEDSHQNSSDEENVAISKKVSKNLQHMEDISEPDRNLISSTEESGSDQTIIPSSQQVNPNYIMWRKKIISQTKSTEVQNLERPLYFTKWPLITSTEEFLIKVDIVHTRPNIHDSSSDVDIITLIRGYCQKCDRYLPFIYAVWQSDVKGICPNCPEDENAVLKFTLYCEFVLQDCEKKHRPAFIYNENAEHFFCCTADELSDSELTRTKVKQHLVDIKKKPVVLRLKARHSSTNDVVNPFIIISYYQ